MLAELDPAAPPALVIPSLLQLGRRAVPQAIEAAIVPAVLFLVVARFANDGLAILAALAWAMATISWRLATSRRVPGIMILAGVTLVVRSILGLVSGSTFLYFLQPTIGGFCLAAAFLVSVSFDRPLARRFAGDFCAIPHHVLAESCVHRFFRRISVMWGTFGLAKCAIALWLLTSQPTGIYVATKTVFSIAFTVVLVAVSAVWFRRTVIRNGLLPVVA
jgi:intracellular septation protein A